MRHKICDMSVGWWIGENIQLQLQLMRIPYTFTCYQDLVIIQPTPDLISITIMSAQNSARVSFAALKNERNKDSEICFNNLKNKIVKNSLSQNLQTQPYTRSPYNVPIKTKEQDVQHSTATRFSNAIKQKNKTSYSSCDFALDDAFEKAQNSIKIRIQQYNEKYAEVAELLADLHIKDLMKLNEMQLKNEQIYDRLLTNNAQSFSFYHANPQENRIIYEIQKTISCLIADKNKSFDCRSTYESKNKNTVSGHSSRVSPQLIKQNLSPIRVAKKSLEDSVGLAGSIRIEEQKSNKAKTDSCRLAEGGNKSTLQDTPQSVKSKISQTNKIKTQKNVVVGMFDRINVCESVEHIQIDPILKNANEKQRGKRDYRYGTSSQE